MQDDKASKHQVLKKIHVHQCIGLSYYTYLCDVGLSGVIPSIIFADSSLLRPQENLCLCRVETVLWNLWTMQSCAILEWGKCTSTYIIQIQTKTSRGKKVLHAKNWWPCHQIWLAVVYSQESLCDMCFQSVSQCLCLQTCGIYKKHM